MWNGIGPHCYSVLPPGTIIRRRGDDPNLQWTIVRGYRNSIGGITYRLLGHEVGYIDRHWTIDREEIIVEGGG